MPKTVTANPSDSLIPKFWDHVCSAVNTFIDLGDLMTGSRGDTTQLSQGHASFQRAIR